MHSILSESLALQALRYDESDKGGLAKRKQQTRFAAHTHFAHTSIHMFMLISLLHREPGDDVREKMKSG